MLLSELLKAAQCDCVICKDGEFELLEQVTRIRGRNALTYVESAKFAYCLENADISCVMCTPDILPQIPSRIAGVAVSDTPKLAFFKLHDYLTEREEKRPTVIDPTAHISERAYVAPYNVVIGKHVEVEEFAAIYEGAVIGDNVFVGYGTVIGARGFTAVREGERMFLAKDAGGVLIEDGVEICSQCDIAKGLLKKDITTLGAYTKLDAKVHIGHGSVLGKRVSIPSGAHVAGNCVVGDDVWIGVNATVSNRIIIGDNARISLGSVVTKNVPDGVTVTGNFAIPHATFMRNLKASLAVDLENNPNGGGQSN